MRRLRRTGVLRGLTRETELTPAHLIQPMFVKAGTDVREDIESMPGVQRLPISELVEEAGTIHAAGISSVLLFGIPADKDERARAPTTTRASCSSRPGRSRRPTRT